MSLKENAKNYLKILQELPEKQKKIILWAVVVVLALIMMIFWINSVTKKFNNLSENLSQLELPKIEVQNSGLEEISK